MAGLKETRQEQPAAFWMNYRRCGREYIGMAARMWVVGRPDGRCLNDALNRTMNRYGSWSCDVVRAGRNMTHA